MQLLIFQSYKDILQGTQEMWQTYALLQKEELRSKSSNNSTSLKLGLLILIIQVIYRYKRGPQPATNIRDARRYKVKQNDIALPRGIPLVKTREAVYEKGK